MGFFQFIAPSQPSFQKALAISLIAHAVIFFLLAVGVALQTFFAPQDSQDYKSIVIQMQEQADETSQLIEASSISNASSQGSDASLEKQNPAREKAAEEKQQAQKSLRISHQEVILAVSSPLQHKAAEQESNQRLDKAQSPASSLFSEGQDSATKSRSLKSVEAEYLSSWLQKLEKKGNSLYRSRFPNRDLYGSVVISLELHHTGKILDYAILKSSGKKAIDTLALDTIKQVGNFGQFPKSLRDKKSSITVYREWAFR